MSSQNSKINQNKTFIILILILELIGLIALLYPSFFLRWYADDYCVAAGLKSSTFFQYFSYNYMGWTGRYSSIFFQGAFNLLGPKAAFFLPSILTVIWFLALSWAVQPFLSNYISKHKHLASMALAGFVLICLYSITPNLFQSVFWNNASISVCLPLILLTMNVGILVRLYQGTFKGWIWVLPISLLTMIAGGFAEMFIAMQVTLYVLMVLVFFFKKHKGESNLLPFLIVGLVSALLAFTIVLIAPGNQVRQAQIGQPATLPELPGLMLKYTFQIFYGMLDKAGWWTLVLVIVSFLFGFAITNNDTKAIEDPARGKTPKIPGWLKQVFVVGSILLVLLLAAVAPSTYIQQQEPEARSVFMAIYFIIVGVCLIMSAIGFALARSRWVKKVTPVNVWQLTAIILIILVIGIGVGFAARHAFDTVPVYQSYARLWDERDQSILDDKVSGKREIITYQLDDTRWGVSDIREDSAYWVNQCMSTYYGVDSITARQVK